MKPPDHYHTQARLCRRDALALAIFGAACAIVLGVIGSSLKDTAFWWLPLALVSASVVSITGAFIELAEARQIAHIRQDKKFELARASFVAAIAQSGTGGATVNEIARRLREKACDIGGQLVRLQESGIILRVPSASPIRYTATAKGLAILAPLIPIEKPTPAGK